MYGCKAVTMVIETEHLRLLPYSPEDLLALVEGVSQFEQRTGWRAADGLREFFVSDDVSPGFLEQLRTGRGADPWTYGFAVVHREDGCVMGSAGFKGPPDENGAAEIAYAIVPAYEGRGFATEAAGALVTFALADERVRVLRAHTLPEPNASTRVLTKCGFERISEVVDPEDGPVWRWERR